MGKGLARGFHEGCGLRVGRGDVAAQGDVAAAGADGGQEGGGAFGEQEDVCAWVGFFEGFEEFVGGGGVHAVGMADEGDFFASGGECGLVEVEDEFVNFFCEDLAAFGAGGDAVEIGMGVGALGAQKFGQEGAEGVVFGMLDRAAQDVGVGEVAVGVGAPEAVKGLLGCQGHGR